MGVQGAAQGKAPEPPSSNKRLTVLGDNVREVGNGMPILFKAETARQMCLSERFDSMMRNWDLGATDPIYP